MPANGDSRAAEIKAELLDKAEKSKSVVDASKLSKALSYSLLRGSAALAGCGSVQFRAGSLQCPQKQRSAPGCFANGGA